MKMRGTIKFKEDLLAVFSHMIKNPSEPDPVKSWTVKPFDGKIDGKTQRIDNKRALATYFGISHFKLYEILNQNPNGITEASKPKSVQPESARQYQETITFQKIKERYAKYYDAKADVFSGQGGAISRMAENLFYMTKRDPVLLTREQFASATRDPRFLDETGSIKFGNMSYIRNIMLIAARLPDVPLHGFTFSNGDEFFTKGLKIKGGKLEDYLQEPELIKFVQNLEAIDVLVMHRLGFEGGGRISSTSMVATEKILYDLNTIVMYEPKVKKTVKRVFVNETMNFVNQYIRDMGLIGRLFKRHDSIGRNYQSFNGSILRAGLAAGLFRYQKDPKTGKYLFKEKVVRKKGGGGALSTQKEYLFEGKKTTSHTTMKHTFVSLASQHGFSLDDCGNQCGTDPATLREYYHGGAESNLVNVVLGKKTFEPWNEWIARLIDPLYRKRYAELKVQGKWTLSLDVLQNEAKVLSDTEEDI